MQIAVSFGDIAYFKRVQGACKKVKVATIPFRMNMNLNSEQS